jgi:hypothetical protein
VLLKVLQDDRLTGKIPDCYRGLIIFGKSRNGVHIFLQLSSDTTSFANCLNGNGESGRMREGQVVDISGSFAALMLLLRCFGASSHLTKGKRGAVVFKVKDCKPQNNGSVIPSPNHFSFVVFCRCDDTA